MKIRSCLVIFLFVSCKYALDLTHLTVDAGCVCDIIYISEQGQDTTTCGSEQDPCRSIKGALQISNQTITTFIFEIGTYSGENNTGFYLDKVQYDFRALSGNVTIGCLNNSASNINNSSVSFTNITFSCDYSLFSFTQTKVSQLLIF